jgi:hypothetical protein
MPPIRCRALPGLLAGLALLVPLFQGGCAAARPGVSAQPDQAATSPGGRAMNRIAEQYVRLALAVGQHDESYVDAYYGPPAWREEAAAAKRPLPDIRREAETLRAEVAASPVPADELSALRRLFLERQLAALSARVDLLSGTRMTFDEESRALYDAVAPTHGEEHFRALLGRLEAALPGAGPLPARLEAFRRGFYIPADRLDAVFGAAIAECRKRTAAHVQLPAGESFRVEYVTDKPWSAYNWYQGNYHSLIQVNTSLPVSIDRAVDLACHEGYPGHHVYNALLEKHLVRDRGWQELTVYPLFSPQSLIAEGSANFGIEVAFPGPERLAFERDVLFPFAGLDPATAARYQEVLDLLQGLDYAGNEAARRYLDGQIDAAQAADWLVTYTLNTPERARQRVRFFDTYRSYVINYNLGRDLVRAFVEQRAAGDPARRWSELASLLSSPRLPSGLTP